MCSVFSYKIYPVNVESRYMVYIYIYRAFYEYYLRVCNISCMKKYLMLLFFFFENKDHNFLFFLVYMNVKNVYVLRFYFH